MSEKEKSLLKKTLVQVQDLKVHFPIRKGILSGGGGSVYAVDGVSFSLNEGETLGIVGESGCGKTTTGLAVLDLIKPTAGKVFLRERTSPGCRTLGYGNSERRCKSFFRTPILLSTPP